MESIVATLGAVSSILDASGPLEGGSWDCGSSGRDSSSESGSCGVGSSAPAALVGEEDWDEGGGLGHCDCSGSAAAVAVSSPGGVAASATEKGVWDGELDPCILGAALQEVGRGVPVRLRKTRLSKSDGTGVPVHTKHELQEACSESGVEGCCILCLHNLSGILEEMKDAAG
eukprot:1307628-Rhodomonas_salina.2